MAQWAGIPGRRRGRHAEPWSGGHHRDLCGLSGGRVLGFTGLDDRDLSAVLHPDPGRGSARLCRARTPWAETPIMTAAMRHNPALGIMSEFLTGRQPLIKG